jgi:hypothetical protein
MRILQVDLEFTSDVKAGDGTESATAPAAVTFGMVLVAVIAAAAANIFRRSITSGPRAESGDPAKMTSEQQFGHELDVFHTEAETAAQFFYAYLTIHAVARDDKEVRRLLNDKPLFWSTTLSALQTGTFIVLGRIFDQQSKYNIDHLLTIAQDNQHIFSKAAHVEASDFRRLRAHVRKHRRTYEAKYRDLRRKFFAHKEFSDGADIQALLAKTNVRELQQILKFLLSLYEALWQLFVNDHRPVLRPVRYSVRQIRKRPSSIGRGMSVQERTIRETESFLRAAALPAQARK